MYPIRGVKVKDAAKRPIGLPEVAESIRVKGRTEAERQRLMSQKIDTMIGSGISEIGSISTSTFSL